MKYFELEDIRNIISENYIHEVDDNTLVQGSLRGVVDSLNDGYSAFYSEEDYQNFDENSEGSFYRAGHDARAGLGNGLYAGYPCICRYARL